MSEHSRETCLEHSGIITKLDAHERRLGLHDEEIGKLKGRFTVILTTLLLALIGIIANLFVLITRLNAGG